MTTTLQNGDLPHLTATSSSQWEEIQRNTFKNWVNEQLKSRGLSIFDLRTDFADGVLLVALAEILQRKKISGTVQRPVHNHEKLHNITIALDAIAKDNVTLINIDSSHITEGHTKLILALVWQLVLRYQIGLSNFKHRSWLLAWIQAVIPDCGVTNLSTDWNSGVALHALLEFCKKGLCPEWRHLNPLDRVNNCRDAMKLARQHFGIPLILRPEDLANSNLDEMSAITYLSYFTKVGSPGYNATLQRIQPLIRNYPVFNFTTDWNDGRVLCELVHTFGGSIPTWPDLKESSLDRLHDGINGAGAIGVEKLISAEEMAEENMEHLGIMAYAARFLRLTPGVITYEHNYKETKIITVDESRRTQSYGNSNIQLVHINNHNDKNNNRTRRDSSSSSSSSSASSTVSESHRQLEYTLVRTPSLRRKQRKTLQTTAGIKKDTYSDGVIIYATSHEVVTPDDIRLEAESPSGRLIKMNGDGMYHAQFGPHEIGTWTVSLLVGGRIIDSCNVNVCDPSQVKVIGLKPGLAGHAHRFNIDCANAGEGKLEVEVSVDGRNVPTFVSSEGQKVYSAGFTPIKAGHYKVSVAFNKAEIRDDANTGPGVEELHRQAVFSTVMKPYHDHYKITATCDWQIDYMTGGPIDLYIGDQADVRVYSMQDGTICSTPHLIADATNAPPGEVKAEVSYGPYRFQADVIEDKPNLYKIVFKPRGPGTYKVFITYDGRLVKGSPFLQEIAELTAPTVEGHGLHKGQVAESCEFTIDARGFPGQLSVDVQGPHFPISSTLYQSPDDTHKVSYVPEEPGIHRINIKLDGKDISGSPYHPKIVDPSKIRVSGGWRSLLDDQDRIPLEVGKEKHLPFEASEAGPGELTADVHGPRDKVPVTVDSRGDGKHTVIFTPKETGKHYIDVKWNGFPLSRSPFIGHATPARHIEPVYVAEREEPVHQRRPVDRHPSSHRSQSPSGYWVRADKHKDQDEPQKVYVLSPNKDPYATSPRRETTAHAPTYVRLFRHGSDVPHHKPRHYMKPKRTSSHYSSSASVRSEPRREPRRKEPEVMITRLPRTSPTYIYDPPVTSDPYIYQTSPLSSSPPSVTYHTIPKPYQRRPADDYPDGKGPSPKVVLRGKGLKQGEVDKPAIFSIDGRNAGPADLKMKQVSFDEDDVDEEEANDTFCSEPEAKISSIRSEPPINIRPTGPKQYQCTYVPRVPGAYLLDIKWNDKPLKCCPFKVDVHSPTYPEKVGVTGDPLKKGTVLGKEMDLKIDPRDAGQGELTIDCYDPDGKDVPVTLTDNYDGTYRLKVKPVKPGQHILNIRLNKNHVFGSPYAIEVHKPITKKELKVWGPGLENGVFPEYQGSFYVDATRAGGGELHVSVMGLKGAFRVEMQRASQKDKLFNCLYHPVEPGIYTINVQWSGHHVEGSPYTIFVAPNEMELLEYDGRHDRSFNSSARSSTKPSSPNITQNSIMY